MTDLDKEKRKKIIWIHNFPRETGAGGVWMYNQYDFLKEDIDIYYLDRLRNPLIFLKHMMKLIIISKRYSIAHAQYGSAVGFLTSLMQCSKILSLKGSDWYQAPNPSFIQKIRIYVGGLLTKFSIKRFDHIIVMSNAMKKQVIKKFPKVKVETIVDPIDLTKFKAIHVDTKERVKKILFASVHLDNPIKQFPLAKRSFDLLHEKMPNTKLVTMSNIPHEEVCEFMNKVDVLLLTSTHEGWPNVVKEILACNRPFVSTNVSDLAALASHTKSCFVCNDDALELSTALYNSLNAEPENLRKHVEPFNMKETLNTIRNIYTNYL